MKVSIAAVGRVKGPLAEAARHYQERAARYWKVTVREVREGRGDRRSVLEQEAHGLQKGRDEQEPLWVLTRDGTAWSSAKWAAELEAVSMSPYPHVRIVLGGAWGTSEALTSSATRVISLGPATLPHDLARVVLLEQLYRAGTIRRGEPYHKGPRR